MPTLKQSMTEALDHYKRKAEYYRIKVENATEGSRIYHEYRESLQFTLGRIKAFYEALEYIDEFLG